MIGGYDWNPSLIIGQKAAKAVMSMDNVWAELLDGDPKLRQLSEISYDSFSVNAVIAAFDALFFNGVDLLCNERSVTAIFATGDDQDAH